MSEKKSAFRSLAQSVESARPADSVESLDLLAVPSLEERARLLLRAIDGEDFASHKLGDAKTAILKAMAADIAARSNSEMPGGLSVKPSGAPIESGDQPRPSVAMSAARSEDRMMSFNIDDLPLSSAIEDRHERERAPAPRQYAARIAPAPPQATSRSSSLRASAAIAAARPAPSPRKSDSPHALPASLPTKRRLFIRGATALTFAVGILGGLALYYRTRSEFETAQSTSLPSLAANPQFSASPAPKNLGQSTASRLERTRTVIAAGDIEAVRIALRQMVQAGNTSAAVDLGSTYDPNILDALGVRNFPADVAQARVWYQKAQQMGSPDAAALLENLERRERPPP
jgi:hypothetical protein